MNAINGTGVILRNATARSCLVLALMVGSCDPSGVVDLGRPIRIFSASNLPQASWYLEGLVQAIEEVGGYVQNTPDAQVIPLLDTDGGDCEDQNTYQAFVALGKAIYICHSLAVRNGSFGKWEVGQLMRHELGHYLGNRAWHRPCESHLIMSPTVTCLLCSSYDANGMCTEKVLTYAEDPDAVSYVCDTGYTIGGICAQRGQPSDAQFQNGR